MAKTVSASVKQALTGRGFFAASAAAAVLLALASGREFLAALRGTGALAGGFHRRVLLAALRSETMGAAVPILAALPFAASVAEDIQSGFIKEYLPRTSRCAYIAGKTAACFLSGGAAPCLGALGAYGLAALALSPLEAGPGPSGGLVELLRQLLLVFLSGGFWAVVGLLPATLTGSRYMAYASPFILYYVLIILVERYFGKLYVLCPREWVAPSPAWRLGSLGAGLLVSGLTGLAALCFRRAAERRLERI